MNFDPKRSMEKEIFTVDFAPLLPDGVTILSAAWSISVVEGVDPAAPAMLIGSASISGSKVNQMIGGGVGDVLYAPVCTAQTSDDRTLVLPEAGFGYLYVPA
jgi:hypothetical protein